MSYFMLSNFSVHKNGKTTLLLVLSRFFALVVRKSEDKYGPKA